MNFFIVAGWVGTTSAVWPAANATVRTAVCFSIISSILFILALFHMGFEYKANVVSVSLIFMAFASQLIYMAIWTAEEKANVPMQGTWMFGFGWAAVGNSIGALVYKTLEAFGGEKFYER